MQKVCTVCLKLGNLSCSKCLTTHYVVKLVKEKIKNECDSVRCSGTVNTLFNIATNHEKVGDYVEAERCWLMLIDLLKGRQLRAFIFLLSNYEFIIATNYTNQGKHAEALKLYIECWDR